MFISLEAADVARPRLSDLAKHIEIANLNGTVARSFIYIDVKDEDAKIFLRQSEQACIEKGNVIFLDINHTRLFNQSTRVTAIPRFRKQGEYDCKKDINYLKV